MSFILINQFGDVVFVLNIFSLSVRSICLERLIFFGSQGNTLGSEQLLDRLQVDLTRLLGVEDSEGCQEMLSWGRFKLILHEDLDHVGLHLLVFNEIVRLVIL